MMTKVFLVLALALAAFPSVADEDWGILGKRAAPAAPAGSPAPETGAGTLLVKGVFALVLVLGLLLGGVALLKKIAPGMGAGASGRGMEILGRTPIGPKHAAVLLRVGGRVLVLGVSGDRMQTLAELKDPEEVERLVSPPAPGGAQPGFHGLMTGKVKQEIDALKHKLSEWKESGPA